MCCGRSDDIGEIPRTGRFELCLRSGQLWWLLSWTALSLGWVMFFAAAVYSSMYAPPGEHRMRGFEWLPGMLIAPIGLLVFCRFPRAEDATLQPELVEQQLSIRYAALATILVIGVTSGLMITSVTWFFPPECAHVGTPRGGGTTHVSPTPTPMPATPSSAPCENASSVSVTGVLMLLHYTLLLGAVFAQWLSVTAPPKYANE